MALCTKATPCQSLVQRRTFWEIVDTTETRCRAYTDGCLDVQLEASLLDRRPSDDTCAIEKASCHSAFTMDDGNSSLRSSCGSEPDCRTTIVLRTSSRDIRGPTLCKWLDEQSFRGCFDFVYVPANFKKMASFGYAFVNFLTHRDAERALLALLNKPIGEPGAMVEMAEWSDPHQGIDGLLERFRNCPVMHRSVPAEYKPLYFRDGVPAMVPKPTKVVIAPREFRR